MDKRIPQRPTRAHLVEIGRAAKRRTTNRRAAPRPPSGGRVSRVTRRRAVLDQRQRCRAAPAPGPNRKRGGRALQAMTVAGLGVEPGRAPRPAHARCSRCAGYLIAELAQRSQPQGREAGSLVVTPDHAGGPCPRISAEADAPRCYDTASMALRVGRSLRRRGADRSSIRRGDRSRRQRAPSRSRRGVAAAAARRGRPQRVGKRRDWGLTRATPRLRQQAGSRARGRRSGRAFTQGGRRTCAMTRCPRAMSDEDTAAGLAPWTSSARKHRDVGEPSGHQRRRSPGPQRRETVPHPPRAAPAGGSENQRRRIHADRANGASQRRDR